MALKQYGATQVLFMYEHLAARLDKIKMMYNTEIHENRTQKRYHYFTDAMFALWGLLIF